MNLGTGGQHRAGEQGKQAAGAVLLTGLAICRLTTTLARQGEMSDCLGTDHLTWSSPSPSFW